jgi:hypothetical protein
MRPLISGVGSRGFTAARYGADERISQAAVCVLVDRLVLARELRSATDLDVPSAESHERVRSVTDTNVSDVFVPRVAHPRCWI